MASRVPPTEIDGLFELDKEEGIWIHPAAEVSPDAKIVASIRGTRITIGANSVIHAFVIIQPVGGTGDVEIGEDCQINPHSVLYSGNGLKIGNSVLVAPCVSIVPTNHAFSDRTKLIRLQGFAPSKGGVIIEDDVWIGANSVLLDGAHIRSGAIIAAGSVVRCEVPEYEIWGGVPARKISFR